MKPALDVDLFLVDCHSWFKLSTARREDFIELRLELESEDFDEFFHRHVSSRWLTMGPSTSRIIKHWESLKSYFVDVIPNSTDQAQKDARNSDRYIRIIKVLKPSNEAANLCRLWFVVYLCSKTELYLKTFQSVKPMAYKFYTDSCLLISILMSYVMFY